MNDRQKSKKIEKDLKKRFPRARFSVRVVGDDISVYWTGGHDYKDVFPTTKKAAEAITNVVKNTVPSFQMTDYADPNTKKTVFA